MNKRPDHYEKLPDGVRCRCINMWREMDGSRWCCKGGAARTSGNDDDVVGHKTFDTGKICSNTGFPVLRHEPLTRAEAEALWQNAKKEEAARAERMPDEKAAIRALWDAHQRLKELGWREPSYCPKDGTRFKVIELGSTGIFDCYYQGEWPEGLYMVMDDRDIYPTSTGVAMFRLYPEDEAKRKTKMEEAARRYREENGS